MGVYGYARGMLKMLFSIVALIISIAAMILLAPFLASILKTNENLMEAIETPIIDIIGEKVDNGVDVESALQEYYHLPDNVSRRISEIISGDVDEAKVNLTQSIAKSIADYVCDLLSYIIVFIVVRMVIIIIGRLLHIVEKIPVISTMNHLGGTTLALAEALVCVWIFFIFMELIHTSQLGFTLINMVWENDFLRMLYQNNLLTYFL